MTHEEAIEKFGEPLTLSKLMEMDGKPVWTKLLVESTGRKEGWALIYSGHTAVQRWTQSPLWYKDYGKTWIAYAYPPAHIDRKAWEPCEKCKHSVDYGLGKRMEGGWRANMHISEIIRRAEKEVATATRNLDMAKRLGAPEQDIKNLKEKVEYKHFVVWILQELS